MRVAERENLHLLKCNYQNGDVKMLNGDSIDSSRSDSSSPREGGPKLNSAREFKLPPPKVEFKEFRPLVRELCEPEAFPTDCLVPALSAPIKTAGRIVQVPEALAANSFLAVASLVAQAHANISIDGRVHPLSGYYASVAMTGDRKDATDDVALKSVTEYQQQLQFEYQSKLLDYSNAKEAFEKKRSAKSSAKNNEDKNVAEIQEQLKSMGCPPEPPIDPVKITSDITIEGLTKYLVSGQPSMAIFSTEGGQILGGYGFNKDNVLKTAAGLSKFWDGKPVTRLRSHDGISIIGNRRVSIHLMIQPNLTSLLVGNTLLADQGLLSRFLISWPKSFAGTRFYPTRDDGSRETIDTAIDLLNYRTHVANLLRLPEPIKSGTRNELEPRLIKPSSAAMKFWIALYNEVESKQTKNQSLFPVKGLASKIAEHAARLAGAAALFQDIECTEVDADTMTGAIEVARYFLGEGLRLQGTGYVDGQLKKASELYAWMCTKGRQYITLVEIYKCGPNWIRDARTARVIVNILIEHGHMASLPGGLEFDGTHRSEAYAVRMQVE